MLCLDNFMSIRTQIRIINFHASRWKLITAVVRNYTFLPRTATVLFNGLDALRVFLPSTEHQMLASTRSRILDLMAQ